MPNYRDAPELMPLVERLVRRDFRALLDADVKIAVLAAHAPTDDEGNPKGAALKLHGYAAAAVVRIVSQKDRVAGLSDAQIVVDGDRWPEFSERRKEAIICHELTHLVPTGKTDDCGRPKLKMRLHDIQLGGFTAIVEQFGRDAPEAELFLDAQHQWSQQLLAFMEGEEEDDDARAAKEAVA